MLRRLAAAILATAVLAPGLATALPGGLLDGLAAVTEVAMRGVQWNTNATCDLSTTPAGVFPLGETIAWDGQRVNVFGNRPDPGVKTGIAYRAVRQQDCWGAIPGDLNYNKLVSQQGCSGPDNEWLPRFGDVYSHAAVIGANMDPVSGDSPDEADRAYAAAIFLHRHSYSSNGSTRPTSGCVSLPAAELATTITLLDPALGPHFAVGPTDWLRTTA